MIDEAEKLVGRLYTTFIMRDLTYVISGGLVIGVVLAPLGVIDLESANPWLVVPAYLVCAYVMGLLLQETAVLVRLMRMVPRQRESDEGSNNYIILMDDIHQHCHPNTVLMIERVVFLKHFGATLGSALLVVGVLLLVYMLLGILAWAWWQLLLTEIILALAFIVCLRTNYANMKFQFETVKQLRKKIEESGGNSGTTANTG
jgi:hypothetical protein